MENPEEVSLLEADEGRTENGSASVIKPMSQVRPYNTALVRWALHRTSRNVLTLADLKQERMWQPVSWFTLIIFFGLFLLGITKLQINYQSSPLNGRYDTFFVGCLIAYTVLFIRGAIIFKSPCVFWILITCYRCSGDQRTYLYEEEPDILQDCEELVEVKDVSETDYNERNTKVKKEEWEEMSEREYGINEERI